MILIELIDSYDEIVQKYKITYVAGGASQNAARGAAVRYKAPFLLVLLMEMTSTVLPAAQLGCLHRLCGRRRARGAAQGGQQA
jgi:hypothetical protein